MSPRDADATMAALGLSATALAVYGRLVGRAAASVAELHEPGESVAALTGALTELAGKGLVVAPRTDPHRYTAVAPDLVLDTLLREQEARVRAARLRIDELATAYRAHITAPTRTLAEVVTGRAAVEQRIRQVQVAARYELRCLERTPRGPDEPTISQQLVSRTLYEAAASPARDTTDAPPGSDDRHQVRTLPAIPVRLYIADDRMALLPLENGAVEAETAVVLRPCGMLDALVLLFETLWAEAVPHPSPDGGIRDDKQLVKLLLSGLTDDAIARQLGISERTVQRQVAALMRSLGATSRFQAGAQAALRTARHQGATAPGSP